LKNSYNLKKKTDPEYGDIRFYDKESIDNPNKRSSRRLQYMDILKSVIGTIEKYYPDPQNILRMMFCIHFEIKYIL